MGEAIRQRVWFALFALCTAVVVAPVVGIAGLLLWRGLPALDWTFLSTAPAPGMREGGILPAIVGTLWLVGGTTVVAFAFGLPAGIYLSEYARRGALTRAVRLAIVNLAGVPSVVYGLFGLAMFVFLLKRVTGGMSIISGSLTLGSLILPVVITATEEALLAVPQALRQASVALGATRWQTTVRVVLPNAAPGILTGFIIGLSRAAGETAPIMFTAAYFYLRHLPTSVQDRVMALPYHLYVVATQIPGYPAAKAWATALVLVGLVLAMNLGAVLTRARLRRRRRW